MSIVDDLFKGRQLDREIITLRPASRLPGLAHAPGPLALSLQHSSSMEAKLLTIPLGFVSV